MTKIFCDSIVSTMMKIDIGTSEDKPSTCFYFKAPEGNSIVIDGITGDGYTKKPGIKLNSARNKLDEPMAVNSGDLMASFSWNGYDGEKYVGSCSIVGLADNNKEIKKNYAPGKLVFITYPEHRTNDNKYLTWDSEGKLAINKFNAEATCDINGYLKLKPLSNEPEHVSAGCFAVADGVNWNPCDKKVDHCYPVFYTGLSWKSLI